MILILEKPPLPSQRPSSSSPNVLFDQGFLFLLTDHPDPLSFDQSSPSLSSFPPKVISHTNSERKEKIAKFFF
jgi:hypothetical protein